MLDRRHPLCGPPCAPPPLPLPDFPAGLSSPSLSVLAIAPGLLLYLYIHTYIPTRHGLFFPSSFWTLLFAFPTALGFPPLWSGSANLPPSARSNSPPAHSRFGGPVDSANRLTVDARDLAALCLTLPVSPACTVYPVCNGTCADDRERRRRRRRRRRHPWDRPGHARRDRRACTPTTNPQRRRARLDWFGLTVQPIRACEILGIVKGWAHPNPAAASIRKRPSSTCPSCSSCLLLLLRPPPPSASRRDDPSPTSRVP